MGVCVGAGAGATCFAVADAREGLNREWEQKALQTLQPEVERGLVELIEHEVQEREGATVSAVVVGQHLRRPPSSTGHLKRKKTLKRCTPVSSWLEGHGRCCLLLSLCCLFAVELLKSYQGFSRHSVVLQSYCFAP